MTYGGPKTAVIERDNVIQSYFQTAKKKLKGLLHFLFFFFSCLENPLKLHGARQPVLNSGREKRARKLYALPSLTGDDYSANNEMRNAPIISEGNNAGSGYKQA